jgi:hypothetical protein
MLSCVMQEAWHWPASENLLLLLHYQITRPVPCALQRLWRYDE